LTPTTATVTFSLGEAELERMARLPAAAAKEVEMTFLRLMEFITMRLLYMAGLPAASSPAAAAGPVFGGMACPPF
jgi:hypothetical protein